ncbi:MAG: DUF4868 domain-containing protein [Hyphomicrobium sp.]|nr:DUF4868 domain-containing protein [Hyphomicrobium sp.]PPD09522.1 MAG: DUF4868 domain-containing protein [Hyphomicrobium sp.]
MTQNLFAACRSQDNELSIKRVRVTQPVQGQVEALFLSQEQAFMNGITEEIEFDGAWKPDANELLTIDIPDQAAAFTNAIAANPISLPDIDAANIADEGVRALFVGDADRVLVQRFAPPQILSRRFSLLLDNNTFKRLEDPAFALDVRLTCVIRSNKIKFKSFHSLRQIIDLFDLYQEATDDVLAEFVDCDILDVNDEDLLKQNADQTCRKLIYAISRSQVLTRHTADEIQAAGQSLGLAISLNNGRITVPTDRKGLKDLLRFLDDGLYEASLSGQRYVTNSKRRV